ncbi:hypothetical protein, partial [Lentzea indica]|uniref:hypothetical protein n=1 Tax=Lentzea indica TaxID=2604800 RepID=UPI001CB6FBB3
PRVGRVTGTTGVVGLVTAGGTAGRVTFFVTCGFAGAGLGFGCAASCVRSRRTRRTREPT